ncbi:hypothetical protein L3Y34_008904 [Caenorhabditis briggsae]|uniref:Uncharacterized protein n=1 Tax=Caenorhabditis briggsae TaxID=6238 RepID=A0AAE9A2M8_CAEBR|nr:hypothetical protein L3Y34_008904 [Caenorhabditis briggsae]
MKGTAWFQGHTNFRDSEGEARPVPRICRMRIQVAGIAKSNERSCLVPGTTISRTSRTGGRIGRTQIQMTGLQSMMRDFECHRTGEVAIGMSKRFELFFL